MFDDQTLDARFEAGDPIGHYDVTDAALDEVLFAVRAHSARRRRRAVVSIAGVGAALVIGTIALPAAADVVREFLAQQVVQRQDEGTEVVPDSAWVDARASDFGEYLATIYPTGLPLPAGYTPDDLIVAVVGNNKGSEGLQQEASFRFAFENIAYCGWVDQWLTANAAADERSQIEATDVMVDSLAWPAYLELDGGNLMEYQQRFATGAQAGDRQTVEFAAEINGCDRVRIDTEK